MILDKEKVSELLADNKGDDRMEYESKSNNTYVVPSNGNRDNDRFIELLVLLGLVDRNGNKTGANATSEQVAHLATSFGITSLEVTGKLDRLQIATCEQTHAITGAVQASSTANLIGQNTLGEKITDNAYKSLIDGGVTRKNDDDNTKYLSNQSTLGFHGVEKSLCALDARMSSQHCEIKGEIKEVKCELKEAIRDSEYRLSTQATHNYNALDKEIIASRTEALVTNKNDQIRAVERENINLRQASSVARDAQLQKDIEDLKKDNKEATSVNILSNNVASAIGNVVNPLLHKFDHLDRSIIAIGNDVTTFISGGGRHGITPYDSK